MDYYGLLLETEICSEKVFNSRCHFGAFMKEAVVAVEMEEHGAFNWRDSEEVGLVVI